MEAVCHLVGRSSGRKAGTGGRGNIYGFWDKGEKGGSGGRGAGGLGAQG